MNKYRFKKVLFLNPPFKKGFSRSSRFPSVTRSGTLYYPVWLSYAAGYLRKKGIQVRLIDAIADRLSNNDILKLIYDFKPDIIVEDIAYESIANDIEQAEILKTRYPDLLYILVGCHTTGQPKESLKMSSKIDAVLIGEYEKSLLEICKGINFSGIKGIAFKNPEGRIRVNDQRNIIKDLNDIPFVSKVYKNHLNIKRYNYGITLFPIVTLLTSRGCPFKCSFCLWPQTITKGRVRTRSPENIAEEFLYIRKEMKNIKEVFIEDDTFNYDKKRVIEICKALIKIRNRIKWSCNVRADLDFEEMNIMKKAGCRLLVVGFESWSQKVLDAVNKKMDLRQYHTFMKNAKKCKLLVHGCFILGLPGERTEDIKKTIDFSLKLDPDTAQYNRLFLLPGTALYKKKDKIPAVDIKLLKYARRKFYLRVGYILKILYLILRSPFQECRRVFRVFLKFFKYFF